MQCSKYWSDSILSQYKIKGNDQYLRYLTIIHFQLRLALKSVKVYGGNCMLHIVASRHGGLNLCWTSFIFVFGIVGLQTKRVFQVGTLEYNLYTQVQKGPNP